MNPSTSPRPLAEALPPSLGIALYERSPDGSLRLAASAPRWLADWPGETDPLAVDESPFLENFLVDAEEFWAAGGTGEGALSSGPWVEGDDLQLEARAMVLDGRAALLLERLGEDYEAHKERLQIARENVIALQRLDSEMRKKEVLLHCVIDDISSALGNVVTSLRLLEVEPTAAKVSYLLSLAMTAARKQEALIRGVVAGFTPELEEFYGRQGERRGASDVAGVIGEAIASVAESFKEKSVQLIPPTAIPQKARIQGERSLLVRMFGALLVNAYQGAPPGSRVVIDTVRRSAEGGEIELSVTDSGPPADAAGGETPFDGLDPFGGATGAIELSFCRVAAENIGGEVGHEIVGDRQGNRFWVRIPEVKS